MRRYLRQLPRPGTAWHSRRWAAELLPTAFVEPTVAALLADDAAVAAYEVAAGARSLAELDVTVLRQLRDALKEQRYLAYATRVARAAVQRAGSPRDLRARRRLEGEIAVVSGAFTPRVAPDPHYRSRPGRILHLVGRGLPDQLSGYTVRTQHTAAAQRAASWDATVVTQMGVHREHDQDVVVDGVTYHRLPGPPRRAVPLDEWFQGHVDRLAELVTKERPALLHAHSDFLNARAAIALKDAFGIPVVYECRGFWEETWLSTSAMRFHWDISQLATDGALPDWYTWRRSAEAAAAGSVDTVVTLDRVMVDHLASRGVPTERIATVPNAVDPALFPVPVRDRARAAQLGIAPDEIVIGYVSSLTDYEGVDVLISAFAQVSASAAGPVTLLVVGDGPARDRLAGMADMYPSARIIFTGAVPTDRVLEYYSLIDIFVVPRPPVPVAHLVTPLKPFEAFSTGRVVVLANVRALASIAEQSGAAVLFEAGDAASLATTLLGLLDDPGERRRLSEIGAGWVRTAHTWQHNAERYAVIYRNLGVNAAGVNASPVARTVASRSLSPPA